MEHKCPSCECLHNGKQYRCNPCRSRWQREWRLKHPERARAIVRNYQKNHPETVKACDRSNHLRRTYGITPEQYDRLLIEQGGVCAICGSKESGGPGKNFHVDHDHFHNRVRGLLCCNCNFVIGHSIDNPWRLRAAANYLEKEVPIVR
jgi:Recombination endonuclease VII